MTIGPRIETSSDCMCSAFSDDDVSSRSDQQWKDSCSVSARMPGGLTPAVREKLWISLAKAHLSEIHLNWSKTLQYAFNEAAYPEDDQFNHQILKDLHRTGCHWSSNDEDRTSLHRVLLAFARYNRSIGYCQGLHILTSIILDVVQMNEEYALMVLIYLIDHSLPDFFSNHLHALAVDMTVFDQWLKIYHPTLHEHLQKLQSNASADEPPLLNVFTIQWFLTIFATCLSRSTTLRVWDALMLEGSEVLFRTGLVLWSKLAIPILKISTTDQFYSAMAHLSVQLLDENIINADHLIRDIYQFGPFPTAILAELRQKFSMKLDQSVVTTNSPSSRLKNVKQLKNKLIDEDLMNIVSCFALLSSSSSSSSSRTDRSKSSSLALDLSQLREEYKQLKQRNQQIRIEPSTSNQQLSRSELSIPQASITAVSNGPLINHLLVRSSEIKRAQPKAKVAGQGENKQSSKKSLHPRSEENLIDRLVTHRGVQTPKYSSFNPFPSRSVNNENVAANGYKLGLYSPVLPTR